MYATHAAGMDISYQCLSRGSSSDTYKIIVKFYRDCDGVRAPPTVTLDYQSSCSNSSVNLSLTGSPVILNAQCSNLCNGGSVIGIEEYTYEGTINLAHCSDWVLSSCVYARNNVISTISNPGRQDLCVQATLDNISDCNNSPTFTQYPTPFICANNLFCYNNGAIEIDGDSLSYELITPLNSNNGNTVTYLGIYSAYNPVGGSSTFDSTTGNFCVTPPNLLTSILAIRVNEYRNGIKIGSIIRDIQINVLSCANSYVSLSGKNDSVTIDILDTNKYRSRINCPSPLDTLYFEINTLNNYPNNVEMTSNINISGANFTIDNNNTPNPKAIFEWIPTLADTINSPYFFTINIQDDNCPVPSNFSFQYEIIIGSSNISTKTETISPSCNGDNDGKISVLASGKSPPFNFEWNNGDTTSSIYNLESNNYSLLITDSVGCSKLLNIFLPEPAQITSSDLITDVKCNGDSTGSIDLTVSGGTKPYNYVWSNNVTVEDVDSLYAGTYKVLITDSNLCSHIDSFIITEPTSLNASLYSNIVSCNGYSDGEVTVLVSGGTSDYFIDIGGYQQQLINNNNLYTSPKIFQSGKYIVSITDFNGCLYTDSVEVLQPDSIQVNAINTDASCYLGSDGTSTLSITGGSSPYVEDWGIINPQNLSAGVYSYVITDSKGCLYNGSTTIYDPLPIQSLETVSDALCYGDSTGSVSLNITGGVGNYITNWFNKDPNKLVAGVYDYLVLDSNGCVFTDSVLISEPAQITSSDLITDVKCNGDSTGSIDLTVSGGTKPYNYVWSNNVTVEDVDSLYAGTYKVLITDSNLCSHIDSFIITEPTSLNASLYSNIVSCNGYSDGEVTVLVSGGTSDYFIDIGGYQQQLINNNNLYTSPKIFQSGKYIVSITDFNGCLYTDSVEVLQPDSIQVNAINTDASCYLGSDGTSTLSITGGSSPYVEDWGIINPQNLSAGVYSYVITDSKGCLYNGSTTIYDPLPIQSLETVSDALCYGDSTGSVSLNITGGVGNYITNWFNKDPNKLVAGVYDYLVLDSNGCVFTDSVLISEPAQIIIYENIFNVNCYGDSSGSVILNSSGGTGLISFDWFGYDNTKLKAGVYNFRAIDMNGCLFEDSITITEPDSLEINSTLNDISCKNLSDGVILITVDKGIPPYNYQWLGPNLFSSTVKDITNLFKGNYELTITDSNGCKKVKSYIINEPEGVTIDIQKSDYNGTNISCKNFSDGQINLQVFGQNFPFTFQWSNGSTSSSLSDLKTGSYECVITDINGCEYDTNIYLTEPNEALNVSIINNNLSNGYSLKCYGQSDGELIANTSGGTPDYSFYWSNGETLSSINNLSAGPYSVYITDLNGCFAYDSIMITEPDELLISFSITNDTCDREIGEIDLGLKGGVPPYKFIIDNDSVTYDYFLQLGSGNYNLKIIDDNKCNIDTFFSISNAVEKPVADFFINPQINNFYDQLDKPFLLADASKYYNDKIKNRTWILDGKTFSDSIFYYSFSDTGNYDISLIILTENNCIDSTSKKIIVHQFDIFVPNSFTPGNTDGINDSFFAKGYGIKEFSLKIYGRWGHLVFSSNNINERWNGKFLNNGQDCPIGNYVYKIDVTSKYGEEKSKIGMLRLIR